MTVPIAWILRKLLAGKGYVHPAEVVLECRCKTKERTLGEEQAQMN